MDWLKRTYDLSGRTSRVGYWRFQIAAVLFMAVILMATVVVIDLGGPGVVPFAFSAPVLAAFVCVLIRRMHDRDRSGWWALLFCLGPLAVTGLAVSMVQTREPMFAALGGLLAVFGLVFNLWALVEVGFRRGARGPNRFGAEPQRS